MNISCSDQSTSDEAGGSDIVLSIPADSDMCTCDFTPVAGRFTYTLIRYSISLQVSEKYNNTARQRQTAVTAYCKVSSYCCVPLNMLNDRKKTYLLNVKIISSKSISLMTLLLIRCLICTLILNWVLQTAI